MTNQPRRTVCYNPDCDYHFTCALWLPDHPAQKAAFLNGELVDMRLYKVEADGTCSHFVNKVKP